MDNLANKEVHYPRIYIYIQGMQSCTFVQEQ